MEGQHGGIPAPGQRVAGAGPHPRPRPQRHLRHHEEARAWAAAQEAKLLAGAKAKDGRAAFLTPADLFRRYRDEVSPKKRGGRWEAVRLDMLCRSAPFGVPLRDFGPEDVARWRDERLKSVAASSVNRELNLVSAVFTTAIKEWRVGLRENPVHLVTRPKNPRARKRRVSDAEIAAVRAQLGGTARAPPRRCPSGSPGRTRSRWRPRCARARCWA